MFQEYTSKDTSINTVNAIYKKGYFKEGDEILDFGGGKYDSNIEYLAEMGIKCFVYDPYNRSYIHNKTVINYFREKQGAEIIVCANVLCVIKEDEIIFDILEKIRSIVSKKVGSKIYIQIYEGDKSGVGKLTSKGFQRNEKSVEYYKFISMTFDDIADIKRKGNIYEITLR